MAKLEELFHNADYEEEIRRLLNQGHSLEEAEEIYAEHLNNVRTLQDEAWNDAMRLMQEEGE
jgi:predicted subunit of tRNA(5-methylaminomethyl-2-thiouridylate) methyltransferase